VEDSVSVLSTIGSELTATASITDNGSDCDASSNTFVETDEVVGAVDPNDIAVMPKGDGQEGYIVQNQPLRYKIRFQNVGTYWAQNVYIYNVIPQGLDPNTITNVVSSHEYTMKLNGQNLEFIYKDIELPDSARNQEGSNGFVEFTIMPRTDVVSGQIIYNQAEIVFDFEEPLATNIVRNTIKYNANVDNRVIIQPNPTRESTTVMLELSKDRYVNLQLIERIQIFDMWGSLLSEQSFGNEIKRAILNTDNLIPGCYLVKVINNHGQAFQAKLIKE
jgi:uncharacterized repeat protein (TIGR01451 family)